MKKILFGFYVFFLIIAIYNSLIAVLGFTVLDSDYSDTAMLWWGYQKHGWRFITSWLYTQDNWLLSLLPWHAVLFSIFSPSPTVVVLSGYFVFLLAVFLCAVIAWVLQAPKTAFVMPLLLLFSNQFAFLAGYIAYPITHNITLVLGLLMVLAAIQWLQHQKLWSLVLMFIAALIGGISDPWLIPCFCFPLIIAIFLLPKKQVHLLIVLAVVLVIIMTNFFGVFYFLKRPAFSTAHPNRIFFQLSYLIKNLGWFFNFFFVFKRWTAIASLILVLILSVFVIKRIIQDPRLTIERRLFFFTWVLSCVLIVLSFIFYSHSVEDRNSLGYNRYFINIYFLTILAIGVGVESYWEEFSNSVKYVFLTLAIVYIANGLYSILPLWKERPHIRREWFEDFLQVLRQNQLTYGYANYWQSSIITWLSQNNVLVRSIGFNTHNGHLYHENRSQTSPYWYKPQDIPSGQKLFFVYFEAKKEICPSLELCRRGLIQQNGVPINTISFKNGIIMVWSHPLIFEVNPE